MADSYNYSNSQISSNIKNKNNVTVLRASSNFVNSVLGTGILGIPLSVKETGSVLGVFLIIIVTLISVYISIQLIILSKKYDVYKFEDLGEESWDKRMFYATTAICILFPIGALINYVIIIYKASKILLSVYIYTNNESELVWLPYLITILIYSFIVTPLSLMTSMSKLSFLSILGVISFFLIFILITYTGLKIDKNLYTFTEKNKFNFSDFFAAVGVLSYALICCDSMFPIYQSLENKSLKNWCKVTFISFGILGGLYSLFSLTAVQLIPDIEGNVLNSKSISSTIPINICRVLLAVTIIFTFPVVLHIMRCYVYSLLASFTWHGPINCLSKKVFLTEHITFTVTLISICVLCGLKIGRLKVVLDITGLLTGTIMGFIIPVIIIFKVKTSKRLWNDFLSTFKKKTSLKDRFNGFFNLILPVSIFIFGLVSFFIGTPLRIIKFINVKN